MRPKPWGNQIESTLTQVSPTQVGQEVCIMPCTNQPYAVRSPQSISPPSPLNQPAPLHQPPVRGPFSQTIQGPPPPPPPLPHALGHEHERQHGARLVVMERMPCCLSRSCLPPDGGVRVVSHARAPAKRGSRSCPSAVGHVSLSLVPQRRRAVSLTLAPQRSRARLSRSCPSADGLSLSPRSRPSALRDASTRSSSRLRSSGSSPSFSRLHAEPASGV